VLYRIAEVMEGRHQQFSLEVSQSEGLSISKARAVVDESIDRWVWYAGWADKLAQVVGSSNPVAGPYFDFSLPEATGVVAVLAPHDSSLLGLTSVIAPAIVSGNTVVAVSSYERPLPAITLGEVMATSDVPGGVVNILTGSASEVGPWLASHMDVNAIDLCGIVDPEEATQLEIAAADNLKRVRRPAEEDWSADQGLSRLTQYLELKTVWHPIGV
jgi:acyl-CoA reductase-like NAD-dependent aldehyde dehydrogenase